ncbi:MAG: hypothetical protein IPN76_26280 [Saprospiraceae bacterium]|nr:hypothetical protein [Saprospiraceae bacterium]
MPSQNEPRYNFSNPIFRERPHLIRLAKDHMELAAMKSDVIDWEVMRTTDLDIPVLYRVHYRFKSIIGINEDFSPIYGNHHIAELSLERPYPLEPCKVYMKSDLWHPNIKWQGMAKGRVCANVDRMGVTFGLSELVLWVGEILQYKNYHAKNEPPFPEDINVAQWVREYAEPNGVFDKEREFYVDDTPLIVDRSRQAKERAIQDPVSKETLVVEQPPVTKPNPAANEQAAVQQAQPSVQAPSKITLENKIKILSMKKQEASQYAANSSIKIKPRSTP